MNCTTESVLTVGCEQHRAATQLIHWLLRSVDTLHLWRQRRKQRRRLSELDDHLLRDIGVSRSEAMAQARKPFWRQ